MDIFLLHHRHISKVEKQENFVQTLLMFLLTSNAFMGCKVGNYLVWHLRELCILENLASLSMTTEPAAIKLLSLSATGVFLLQF